MRFLVALKITDTDVLELFTVHGLYERDPYGLTFHAIPLLEPALKPKNFKGL